MVRVFPRMSVPLRLLAAAATPLALISPATAQWTVINLHPAGATESAPMA